MFKYGIRNRLLAAFFITVFLSLATLGSYLLWYSSSENLNHLTMYLTSQARLAGLLVENDLSDPAAVARIDTALKELANEHRLRITLVAADGTVLADSWENPAAMESHHNRPEIAGALSGSNATSQRYSTTINENSIYTAVPVFHHGNITGAIRASTTLANLEAINRQMQLAIFVSLLITSLLAAAASFYLARRYTSPIEAMAATTRRIAEEDIEQRIHIRTGDELELLAHSINHLTSRLEDKIIDAERESHQLELILEKMDNAVLLLDRFGHILKANRRANEVFSLPAASDKLHNIAAIGSSRLDLAFRDAAATNTSRSFVLSYSVAGAPKIFHVFLAPAGISNDLPASLLVVFSDITAHREIQEKQSKFVTNASHELATPLTSIIGFSESLLDGALENPETAQKFVSIIHSEAKRMNELVNDLLKVSRLDTSGSYTHVAKEPVLLDRLLAEVAHDYEGRAAQKQLSLQVEADTAELTGNAEWLKIMFANLLDNAVRYTPQSGAISVLCRQAADYIECIVADTGPGIPQADLPFVFDRFYRVDASRSRLEGGAGLGLSVVKYVVEMHQGTIDVESKSHSGTKFIIRLPKR